MRYWIALLLAVALVAMPAQAGAVEGIRYEGPFSTYVHDNITIVSGDILGPTQDPPASVFIRHNHKTSVDASLRYSFSPYTQGVWRIELDGAAFPSEVWFLPRSSMTVEIVPGVYLVSAEPDNDGRTFVQIRIKNSFNGVAEIRRVEFYIEPDTVPPPPVLWLNAVPGLNSVHMTWGLSDAGDLLDYVIYVNGELHGTTTERQYTVTDLPADHPVTVAVRARDKFGNLSDPVERTVTPYGLDETPPEPPAGLAYTPGMGSIRLDWLASPEPDVAGYRVYVDGELVADIESPGYTLDAPEYRAYEVAVTAYDASGNESAPSTITAYPVDPNAPVSPPGPPRNLLARPGPRSVILQWSPPSEGADSYRVSRDGEYLGETTTTKWEDRGVSPNATYSYAVVAVNAAGDSPPATVMVHTPDAGPLDGVESQLGGLPGAVLSGLGLFSPIAWVAAALILAHVILTRGLQMIAGRRRA